MKKIMFNDKYKLTELVLQRQKTQTRRIAYSKHIATPIVGYCTEGSDKDKCVLCDGCFTVAKSTYKVGEIVAVAQSYDNAGINHMMLNVNGSYNKMFVKSELMPHQIRITNIRCERLKDISDVDCLAEGIQVSECDNHKIFSIPSIAGGYGAPRMAFETLIDKISGNGTWWRNPYVFVYEFELVK